MSNVIRFPRKGKPRSIEEAIEEGLKAADAEGITCKVLMLKMPEWMNVTYLAIENEETIREWEKHGYD